MDIPTRNQQIRQMRAKGRSLSSIARTFGISRQRVHQIAPQNPHGRLHRGEGKARAEALYSWIVAYMEAHYGLPPTYAEMGEAFQLGKNTVAYYLKRLAASEKIVFYEGPAGSPRGFYLPGSTWTPPPSSPNTTP